MKWFFSPLILAAALISLPLLNAQSFSNPVRIPTSQDPTSVFVVDLNGDGLPDLLYETIGVNSTPSAVQTLLAQSSGGYVQGPTTILPSTVGGCRPVDVNNDGKQDLVCINNIDVCDLQIATLLGNGDGSFQPAIYSGLMQSNCQWDNFIPWLYRPADVNSDSIPDLIVGDAFNYEFFVLLGDGKGHFNVSFTAFPASVQFEGEILAADLNGDGKPDLFTNVGPWVWLGKGDGTFLQGKAYGSYDSCTLYDLEADGHPDAICVNPNTNSSLSFELDVLHGNADGSFNTTPIASQPQQGGFGALTSPTVILDVNGDGLPDILGSSSDGLSVLLGQSHLKFKAPVHYAVGNFASIGDTTSQVADLNQDGYKDIICIGTKGLYISYGTKNGTYEAPATYPVASLLNGMTVGDFNGDGIPDIAVTGDQNIELSLGNGDGTFQAPVSLPNADISFASVDIAFNIAHGDFRGNGRQDILAVGSPGTYEYNSYILFNNGDGTFQPPQELANSSVLWPSFELFAIADFNQDGRDDFFTTSSNFQTVYVGLSNGDGTFNTVTTALPFVGELNTSFPALADFDKDGKPDLVYLTGANAYVLKGNGDGSFNTNALVLPIPPYQGQSFYYKPLWVATGDFDGDGNPDFAVLATVGPYVSPPADIPGAATAVYVFYGNGDGTFSAPVIAGGFNEVYDTVKAADLSKDGRSDLILYNAQTGSTGLALPGISVGVVPSLPGRLFGPEQIYTSGQSTNVFVADVNQDGFPDLLISNSSFYEDGFNSEPGNAVTELLNLGSQTNPNLAASSTNLAASGKSFVAGSSITFTATVSGTSSSGSTPSGSVRFADQTGVESTVPLASSSNASAAATFTTSTIGVGADTMSATYSGDSTFAPSFATIPLTATGLPDTIAFSVTPNPVSLSSIATVNLTVSNPAGSTAAVPTGYIEFRDGSTIIGGPNSLSNGSTTFNASFTTAGTHTLSAWYSGDLTHVSNTATQTETVLVTPSVSISAPTLVTTVQVLSAAISVSGGSGNPTPTGSVTLTISTTENGGGNTSPATTLSNGGATINIPAGSLAVGTYWLTATYTPDAASSSIYLSSSIMGYYVSVTAPPPTFAISGTAVTVAPGATTGNTSTITVTPGGGFTGGVALSASITSSPNGAQYPPSLSFGSTSPVSITGASAGTATLTVLTTAPTVGALTLPVRPGVRWYASSGAALSCILFFGIRAMRRSWRTMLGMLMLLVVLADGVLACSGGGGSGSGGGGGGGTTIPGTTAGTYIVTVTGSSGGTSETCTVTLTVQ
jgi:hypothetical protein